MCQEKCIELKRNFFDKFNLRIPLWLHGQHAIAVHMKRLNSLIFAYFLCLNFAYGAEIGVGGVDSPGCDKLANESHYISLSLIGKIEPGDSEKIERRIHEIEQPKAIRLRVGMLKLSSPGGDLAEAMRIGRLLRSRQISTFVTSDASCASACVFILAAGVSRIAFGPVVIHSFFVPGLLGSGEYAKTSKILDKAVSDSDAYFREMRVSRTLLDAMLQVQHSDAKELSIEELSAFGLVGRDPAYVQSFPKK